MTGMIATGIISVTTTATIVTTTTGTIARIVPIVAGWKNGTSRIANTVGSNVNSRGTTGIGVIATKNTKSTNTNKN